LGGFDPVYVPAYYEDSDLAFRVRAHGRKVYYQPLCVVVHFEGRSNGTDTSAGVKRHQVTNRATFLQRWQDVLTREHFANGTCLFHAKDRSRHKPSLLLCDHYVPMFDRDAGSRTIFEYIKLFVQQGFSVKFLPDNLYPHEPYTTALHQLGVEVLYGGHYVDTIHDWIRENGRFFDYVFISRANIASKYLQTIKASSAAPILFYGSDLHFMRMESEAAALGIDNAAEVAAMRKMEEEVLRQVDVAYYPAEFECEWVRKHFPEKKARVFPIYIYTDGDDPAPTYEGTADLLFVAGFGHPPNCTSLLWFIEKIFPRIVGLLPEIHLNVAGSNVPPHLMALQSANIKFFSNVSDAELAALYARTRVSVVPLRFGGGVKGKVVDALYRRIPLVTTSIGAQGLAQIESVARISDDPQEFASHVVEIYRDPRLWRALSQSSRPYIMERFSLDAVTRMLAQDIPEIKVTPITNAAMASA
jgi:glycosyltransferase involved in cell wall biosynthesis